jgi:hypothetical protein
VHNDVCAQRRRACQYRGGDGRVDTENDAATVRDLACFAVRIVR